MVETKVFYSEQSIHLGQALNGKRIIELFYKNSKKKQQQKKTVLFNFYFELSLN